MIGIDNNILVRLVTKDDPYQLNQVLTFLSKAKANSTPLYINHIVLCELVWVLKKEYKYPKNTITSFLDDLIHTKEILFTNKEVLSEAIQLYKKGRGDFADYLTFTQNKKEGCSITYSFDTQLIKEKIFQTP
ncbi:MAG TPA: type II toxin-antitoxin system VapC family toxin [Alphaproteobacteria bacterium]|nr:type II toxin-antitoxin system VapC family toxin [Alphaproteobacteria bacterium]HQS93615.1 type II toxin-antitoxin system VapC family toxin [Alphaproteobacteria bacterium]